MLLATVPQQRSTTTTECRVCPMELPLGGPALRHYTRSRPRPHRQIQNHRPSRPQETIKGIENEVPELMGRVDEGVEEFFTKRVLPVDALKDQDEEPPIIVEEVALASSVPCQPPSRTLRRRLGEFFAIKKRRGVKSDTSHEGRAKKTSIADLIRPLREAAKAEKDKDKVKENESEKRKEKEDNRAVTGESVLQETSATGLTPRRVEAVPPRRALRDGKSQSLILLSGSATAGTGTTKSAGKKNSSDGQHSFEQKLHLMLQRIGVSKPPPGETHNQEGEMKKAESEGTIIDNKPEPPPTFMKPRTMSTSSDTRRPIRSSVSIHESAGKPTLPPKPFIKLSSPPTSSGNNTPEKELAQIEEGEPIPANLTCASSSPTTTTIEEAITSTPISPISAPVTTEPTFINSILDLTNPAISPSTTETSDTCTGTASATTTSTTLLNDTTPFVAATHSSTPVLPIFNSSMPSTTTSATKIITDPGQTDSTESITPSASSLCMTNSEMVVVLASTCPDTLSTTALPTDALFPCLIPTTTPTEGPCTTLTGTSKASSTTNSTNSNSNFTSFIPISTASPNPKSSTDITTYITSSNGASNSTQSHISIVFPTDLTLSTSQANPASGSLLTLDSTSLITTNSTSPKEIHSVNSICTSPPIHTAGLLLTDKITPITTTCSIPTTAPVASHSTVTFTPNITALTTSPNPTNSTSIIHGLTHSESTSQITTNSASPTTTQTLQPTPEEKPTPDSTLSMDKQEKEDKISEKYDQYEKTYDARKNLEQKKHTAKEINEMSIEVNKAGNDGDLKRVDNGIIENAQGVNPKTIDDVKIYLGEEGTEDKGRQKGSPSIDKKDSKTEEEKNERDINEGPNTVTGTGEV